MSRCGRCGTQVKRGERLCAHCAAAEQEPIHAQGEVIPPGGEAAEQDRPAATSQPPFRTALALAIAADILEIVLFPLFSGGVMSPANDVVDIVVALTLTRLIGWHWVFLPSFIAEMVPLVGELPCWTLAVLYVRAEHERLASAR